MEIFEETVKAIEEALSAGACWRAARINKANAAVWQDIAARHSARAATLVGRIAERSGA